MVFTIMEHHYLQTNFNQDLDAIIHSRTMDMTALLAERNVLQNIIKEEKEICDDLAKSIKICDEQGDDCDAEKRIELCEKSIDRWAKLRWFEQKLKMKDIDFENVIKELDQLKQMKLHAEICHNH